MADVGSVDVAIRATTDGLSAGISDAMGILTDAAPALGGVATAAAAAISAGIAGIGASLYAFSQAQTSATGLAVALRNSGDASRATLQDMLNFDEGLSEMSNFTHKQIEEAQTFLATQGLQGEALKRATQATVDLGTQTGNLTMAARLLGNAYEGSGTGLRRFGIIIEQGTPPAMMFNEVMDQITQKFGGRAAADAQTFSGLMAELMKIIQEMGEHIGAVLAPAVSQLIQYVNDHKAEILKFGDDIGDKIIDVFNKLKNLIGLFDMSDDVWQKIKFLALMTAGGAGMGAIAGGGALSVPGAVGGGLLALISGIIASDIHGAMSGKDENAAVGAWQFGNGSTGGGGGMPDLKKGTYSNRAAPATNSSENAAVGMWQFGGAQNNPASDFQKAWTAAYDKVFADGPNKLTTMIARMTQLMRGFTSALAGGINQFFQGILMNGENLGQALMHIGTSLLNFVFSAISQMLAEWITKHIIMAAINKAFNLEVTGNYGAAAVAQLGEQHASNAAMSFGIQGLANANLIAAYAAIPFIGPELAAAAMIPADAAIDGFLMMASGGILNGPTRMIAGEAGREAVIPLTGEAGKSALREIGAGSGGGGGETHIHLHGAAFESSPAVWERLIRNTIVPALEKNGRKTSRTRGTTW